MVDCIGNIMKGVLFYQFICCSAIIASSLTAFHRYSDTLSFDLVFALAPMVTELFSIYIYCSYTDELTTDVRKIGYIFYDSLWYEMNVREQKCVTLIIQRAQKPFQWNGYGNCSCSHRKLLKVRKRRIFFHHLLLISFYTAKNGNEIVFPQSITLAHSVIDNFDF